jgi:hypothetical protein
MDEYAGVAFSGAFFGKDFLKKFLCDKLGDAVVEECENDILLMFSAYVDIYNYDSPLEPMYLLDAADLRDNKDDNSWFIGLPLSLLPERMSRKRFNIDVRELLTQYRLITETETDPDLVNFLFDTIVIRA